MNLDNLTIICPTYNRPYMLDRTLKYYSDNNFSCKILIVIKVPNRPYQSGQLSRFTNTKFRFGLSQDDVVCVDRKLAIDITPEVSHMQNEKFHRNLKNFKGIISTFFKNSAVVNFDTVKTLHFNAHHILGAPN